MDKSLYDSLKSDPAGRLPLHMPGHKRNELLAPYLQGLGAALDVTEIEGYDNLHRPRGILLEGMRRAAALWGACRSFYLVNGSTGGILAGMRALSGPGDKVIMQRESHLSVYQGLGLMDLSPVYLYPEISPEYGIPLSLEPDKLAGCLEAHPDARLLVLTCPTYEGVLSDLKALVRLAHQRGLKVLVDAAHGAHLSLDERFPPGAVASGADIVIQSLHKTLPSLTQTALAHAADEETASLLAEQLDLFQTSSPSYLLMASIDGCVRLLEERGQELFEAWHRRLEGFYEQVRGLKHLSVFGADGLPEGVFDRDPGKLLIGCAGGGLSGHRLEEILRERYGIDLEMASPRAALAMTGMGDREEAPARLAQALEEVDRLVPPGGQPPAKPLPEARTAYAPSAALNMPRETAAGSEAQGRVCAEYVTVYPPGIPLLIPGEVITPQIAAVLENADKLMKSRSRGDGRQIAVLKACD